jgi:citrate lyase beta subunit
VFLVNLPKITKPRQVAVLADLLSGIEYAFALPYGRIKVELMIETPQALDCIPDLIDASRGRCFGLHFGAYDYMTACNISGASQSLGHPMAFYARQRMQVAAAQRGVFLSDGATVTLPIPPHRGGEVNAMYAAMKLHYQDAMRSLENGLYQGWDLHPAQIPTRYAALYTYFLSSYEQASRRLKNFVEQAAQATRIGGVFDDAATAQGLVNYFLRALSCGALTEEEVLASGLSLDQIRRRSFSA